MTSKSATSEFVYVTYIQTTPEKLWAALTQPEFTRAYWSGVVHDTDWQPGSSSRTMDLPLTTTIPLNRVSRFGEHTNEEGLAS